MTTFLFFIMRYYKFSLLMVTGMTLILTSCSTLQKTSIHGLTSGNYKLKTENKVSKVYLDVTDEKIEVYHQNDTMTDHDKFLSIPVNPSEGELLSPVKIMKQSLDIDLTSIVLKYRPSVYGLPPQLTTDLNAALYAGWRHDHFTMTPQTDPLGKLYRKTSSFGYDLGVFAGPGTTQISAFTTNNRSENEYSGMIIQTGIAGFLESDMASFGIAVGFDYLLNRDSDIWIYHNKPWIGFVVGIAIN